MSKKIIVVDDDAETILMLKIFLEREGYDVTGAYSEEEGLRKIEELKPDLIIIDDMIPYADGWEVCKDIKENSAMGSIPVSMLSTLKDREDIKKSFEYAHADGHLAKPIDLSVLKETVEKLM